MGSTSRYGQAVINPAAPEAVGVCDRCGFLYNLRQLRWQRQWAGTAMQNLHLRVCDKCWDIPSEQLRTLILPPDPTPVADPRTELYTIDEINHLTLSAIIGKPAMLIAESDMGADLQATLGIPASFSGIGDMVAALRLDAVIAAPFSDADAVTASLLLGIGLTAPFSDAGAMTADVDVVTPAGVSIDFTDSFNYQSTSPMSQAGVDIGVADADRLVFCCFMGFRLDENEIGVTSVDIGGIAASRAAVSYGQFSYVDVWFANVPTGATATVDAVSTQSTFIVNVDVYRVLGADVSNPLDNVETSGVTTAVSTSATVDIPSASGTIASAMTGLSSSGTTSSLVNITEDSDNSVDITGAFINSVSGSREDTASAGSVTITADAASDDVNPQKTLVGMVLTDTPDIWIAITATDTSWSVPADWNNSDNSIHVVAAGGTASDPGAVGGGGCGGGAWAVTNNLTLTPGGTARAVIGAAGSDSYFSNTGSAPTSTSEGVLAKCGVTNTLDAGGAGGASASCIGDAANSGGAGGNAFAGLNGAGAGGGGAGGPNGVGAAGGTSTGAATRGGGGGGGANGGTVGANATGTAGARGGSNRQGQRGPTAGAAGIGGAGGAGASTADGGAGSMEFLWRQSSDGVFYGPGSGGGGGKGNGAASTGGAGGNYGGGAGGSSEDGVSFASGGAAVIMVRYKPTP